jgi:hypothetical protein
MVRWFVLVSLTPNMLFYSLILCILLPEHDVATLSPVLGNLVGDIEIGKHPIHVPYTTAGILKLVFDWCRDYLSDCVLDDESHSRQGTRWNEPFISDIGSLFQITLVIH